MSWVDFRQATAATRFKMKIRNASTLQKARAAERSISGPVLIRRTDFAGCLDHLPDWGRKTTSGQIIA